MRLRPLSIVQSVLTMAAAQLINPNFPPMMKLSLAFHPPITILPKNKVKEQKIK